MIYCIENNQYGMGTSKERSSSNSTYYTMGNHIPGFKLDGMNVLMIREVRGGLMNEREREGTVGLAMLFCSALMGAKIESYEEEIRLRFKPCFQGFDSGGMSVLKDYQMVMGLVGATQMSALGSGMPRST